MNDFDIADEKVHPVETQWHYQIMVKAGFLPLTKEAVGFVRKYNYEHPDGRKITVATGVNADYWDDTTSGEHGYWSTLEPYLKSMSI